jgi:L-alanine-DL-glutamate epimerase-like enolase superfamily enzyme
MKITGFSTTLYEFPLNRRMGDANSPSGRIRGSSNLVQLFTDEGITGVAFGGGGAGPQIKSMVEGMLMGEDPRHVTGLWKRMVDRVFKGGHAGIVNDAISVLDVALWDLKAKANDEPLWKTLGGSNPTVKAYASGLDTPLSDDDIENWYGTMASDFGFTGGKLKVGLDQDDDLRRIERMKKGLERATDTPELYIDANEFWNPKQAIRKVREMEEQFDIAWVEEPARRWDFLGLRRISDAIKAPVCAGENLDTLGEFLPYFHNRSADVVQVSWGMTGITTAMQLADAAYGFELPITLGGSPGNLNAQLAPCMPNFLTLEVQNPDPDDGVMTSDIKIVDGWAVCGDQPGTGVSFDQEALEKATVESVSASAGPSPFGRRPGAGLWDNPATKEEAEAAASGVDGFAYVPKHGSKTQ